MTPIIAPELTRLSQARDLSQQMLEAARLEEWDSLARLEEQRRTLLSEIWANPMPQFVGDAVANMLREILALDAQTVPLAEHARQEAQDHVHLLHQSQRAMSYYQGQE